MKPITLLHIIRLKQLVIGAVLIACCHCSTWTHQNAETAVDVAQNVLSVVAQMLARADRALEVCDDMERSEPALFVGIVLASCTDIVDARGYLDRLRLGYQAKGATITEDDLRTAVSELDAVLAESGLQ